MTHFPDLSVYEYSKRSGHALNVGWLGQGHSFETGPVSTDVRDALVRLAGNSVNVMRGLHYCDFCDAESPLYVETSDGQVRASLGTGEIQAIAENGVVYLAPTLLVHYIDAHDYLPPAVFLSAVKVSSSRFR